MLFKILTLICAIFLKSNVGKEGQKPNIFSSELTTKKTVDSKKNLTLKNLIVSILIFILIALISFVFWKFFIQKPVNNQQEALKAGENEVSPKKMETEEREAQLKAQEDAQARAEAAKAQAAADKEARKAEEAKKTAADEAARAAEAAKAQAAVDEAARLATQEDAQARAEAAKAQAAADEEVRLAAEEAAKAAADKEAEAQLKAQAEAKARAEATAAQLKAQAEATRKAQEAAEAQKKAELKAEAERKIKEIDLMLEGINSRLFGKENFESIKKLIGDISYLYDNQKRWGTLNTLEKKQASYQDFMSLYKRATEALDIKKTEIENLSSKINELKNILKELEQFMPENFQNFSKNLKEKETQLENLKKNYESNICSKNNVKNTILDTLKLEIEIILEIILEYQRTEERERSGIELECQKEREKYQKDKNEDHKDSFIKQLFRMNPGDLSKYLLQYEIDLCKNTFKGIEKLVATASLEVISYDEQKLQEYILLNFKPSEEQKSLFDNLFNNNNERDEKCRFLLTFKTLVAERDLRNKKYSSEIFSKLSFYDLHSFHKSHNLVLATCAGQAKTEGLKEMDNNSILNFCFNKLKDPSELLKSKNPKAVQLIETREPQEHVELFCEAFRLIVFKN